MSDNDPSLVQGWMPSGLPLSRTRDPTPNFLVELALFAAEEDHENDQYCEKYELDGLVDEGHATNVGPRDVVLQISGRYTVKRRGVARK
ncbi:hypothetical protein NPIL_148781 [Nephila pilipes]|uniref:Uncharacterized protein n=1 Tax=Nephila pilipes TaxID=299642 RepID=A0A8X6U5M2_NEPPI|nr:hypothetical protein NPIL_148781 [Nephila pilipes]